MATVTKPIALDESINTTEQTPRNIADVLAEELKGIADNILPPSASQIAYDNTESGLTATNVQDAIDEVISSQADVIADTMADLTENKTATITDGIADFETIDGSLVKSLVVEIEPSQSGSGTPSPDNIRPITGWTQEDVTVVGKNKLGAFPATNPNTSSGVTYSIDDNGIVTVNGTSTGTSVMQVVTHHWLPLVEGKQYIITCDNSKLTIDFFGTNSENDSGWVNIATNITTSRTFTLSTAYSYYRFNIRCNSGVTFSNEKVHLMLCLASEPDSTFEPYKGKTYTTPFNQTVYGGTLDVLSGELTITHGYVDLGTLTWTIASTQTTGKYRFNASCTPLPKPTEANTDIPDLISSNYTAISPSDTYRNVTGATIATNGSIYIYDEALSANTAADFKTAMNGVQLAYELATPTTITLTPQTVKSLVGENHISASTGEVLECKFSMLINGDDLEMLLS